MQYVVGSNNNKSMVVAGRASDFISLISSNKVPLLTGEQNPCSHTENKIWGINRIKTNGVCVSTRPGA